MERIIITIVITFFLMFILAILIFTGTKKGTRINNIADTILSSFYMVLLFSMPFLIIGGIGAIIYGLFKLWS